jgi:hypothetical protein
MVKNSYFSADDSFESSSLYLNEPRMLKGTKLSMPTKQQGARWVMGCAGVPFALAMPFVRHPRCSCKLGQRANHLIARGEHRSSASHAACQRERVA